MKKELPRKITMTALLAACLLPGTGTAATLYDEATQVDLGQGAAAPVFQAPSGTDVVNGMVSWIAAALDIDAFSFVVQPGQTVGNLKFSFSDIFLGTNEAVGGNVFLYSGTVPFGLVPLTNIAWIARAPGSIYGQSSPSPVLIDTGSLGPGTYTVSVEPNGRSINGGAVPYSVSFDVTSIPEPETSAAMLAGCGLLFFVRRRRDKHRLGS